MYYVNFLPDDQGNPVMDSHGQNKAPDKGYSEHFPDIEALRVKYPDIAAFYDEQPMAQARAEIDHGARANGVSIERSHAYKYAEAILYKSGITQVVAYLKYLEREAVRCNCTMDEAADLIISKAQELEPKETARVAQKSQV